MKGKNAKQPQQVISKPKVKKGDEIVVISDKGRRGKIVSVDGKKHTCIVEKINEYKKHQKPSKESPQGGIITVAMPLHISNIMVIDKTTNKPTRVGRKKVGDKALRYAKISGQLIDSE